MTGTCRDTHHAHTRTPKPSMVTKLAPTKKSTCGNTQLKMIDDLESWIPVSGAFTSPTGTGKESYKATTYFAKVGVSPRAPHRSPKSAIGALGVAEGRGDAATP